MVDLKKGESLTFLGFEYRRVLSLQRKWRPYYAPKLKKRTALFEMPREFFRQHVSWPVEIDEDIRGDIAAWSESESTKTLNDWLEKMGEAASIPEQNVPEWHRKRLGLR